MGSSLRLVDEDRPPLELEAVRRELADAPPEAVLEWARDTFGDDLIVTSSFGAESALMLHLASRILPKAKVVFLDTGYLFPETYRFAEELRRRFEFDLRVYTPVLTAARQEALYGKLWEGGDEELALYNKINKVEPMDRALAELAPRAWLAGLRREQNAFRAGLEVVEPHQNLYKVHPILNFNDEAVRRYMHEHDLPYHPLYQHGYRSIGDVHSTRPTQEGEEARSGRRLGPHLECGIHLPRTPEEAASLKSSGL